MYVVHTVEDQNKISLSYPKEMDKDKEVGSNKPGYLIVMLLLFIIKRIPKTLESTVKE